MIDAVLKDMGKDQFNEDEIVDILDGIQMMTQRHDMGQDGLNFLELYTASGGRLEEL